MKTSRGPWPLDLRGAQRTSELQYLRLLNVRARCSSAFDPWFGGEETVQQVGNWWVKFFCETSLILYLYSHPSLSSAQAFLCLLCSFWKFSKFLANMRKWQWLNLLLLGRWMPDITILSFWDLSDNVSLFSCEDKCCTQFYTSVRSYRKCAKRSDNVNGAEEVH